MRRDDVRFAAAARDDGIHKISKFTWRAGAAGVVCSALMAVAFGHHVATTPTTPSSTDNNGTSQSHQPASGNNGSGSNQGSSNQGSSNQGGGGISVPAQPPAPAKGGGQVTSGAT
jgi:hypothetical protein